MWKANHIIHIFGYIKVLKAIPTNTAILTLQYTNNSNKTYFCGVQDSTGTPYSFCIENNSTEFKTNTQAVSTTNAITVTGYYYTNS